MPSNNAPSAPESPATPKAQENPWYIQHFTKLLIGFGLGGGAIAILLPWMLWFFCGMSSGSSDQLRLHLLYITGGIIAVLTLLQTNWKNQGDRLKIDADIKKNEQDAEKNERDHIRQVHAERRSRYTKAVEQLADEKAAVRLGGVYTLTGLVDEWIEDMSLTPQERRKEGQVIINNLCAYIRSPFPLIDKQYAIEKNALKEKNIENHPNSFLTDKTKIQEEQEVRRTIFTEISNRVSTFDKFDGNKIVPGTWSKLEFNFVKSYIFYSLSNLNLENPNFSQATFLEEADFIGTIFFGKANFSEANFTHQAHFSWTALCIPPISAGQSSFLKQISVIRLLSKMQILARRSLPMKQTLNGPISPAIYTLKEPASWVTHTLTGQHSVGATSARRSSCRKHILLVQPSRRKQISAERPSLKK